MSKVLVQCNDNWSDEMDTYGWDICDKDWLDKYLQKLENHFKNDGETLMASVGTNEDIYYSCYSDVISSLTIKEITDKDEELLRNIFGTTSAGLIPGLCLESSIA